MYIPRFLPLSFISLALVANLLLACSGGGNDVTFGPGDGDGGSGGGSGDPVLSGGASWLVTANVAQDGCQERISNVRQVFSLSSDGNTASTSLRSVNAQAQGAGFISEYQTVSGECTRTFTAKFLDISVNNSQVQLTKKSDCGAAGVCENHWNGTATIIK